MSRHPDPHVLHPDHAPTPFTAAEIRKGCPPGRTMRLLVEPAGAPARIREIRFEACDEEGATQVSRNLTVEGEPLGSPERTHSTWFDLQEHASFPAQTTSIEAETIDLPLGHLECLRYTVERNGATDTFWFARSRPGMPVRFSNSEGGKVTLTVTMTDDVVNPAGSR